MNFLAHLFLSKNNEEILIGNFIADAVKGNKFKNYRPQIQVGIKLHREIDTFTDNHPIVKKSKKRLNPQYKHYSGVIIDIFYDHYLAKNWNEYSKTPLNVYAKNIYDLILENSETFPEKIQKMIPYMIQYNWLEAYKSVEGIERVLIGMNNRTKGLSKMNLAIEDLKNNYTYFEKDFKAFFDELIKFTNHKTTVLLKE